ncbi:MAG: carbon starvation protein A [Vicinamibacterales bacterium]
MNILVPVAAAAACLLLAYRWYPRYIARVFREDDTNVPPCELLADGKDYVKSRTHVVFGHHFATIAGAGPIVGPTLALAYGWQPVWLWVVIGGIFFGAMHDMTAMFVSAREGGKTVGTIARTTLGPLGYLLNLAVLIFVIAIVNAIFLNLSVTALTSLYPLEALRLEPTQNLLGTIVEDGVVKARIGGIATTSVFLITAFAPLLGWLIRKDRLTTPQAYGLASALCVVSVIAGFVYPISMSGETWRVVMTGYILLACALPVWLVLQPRDFTNVQILYGGVALLFLAAIIAGFKGTSIQAPAVDLQAGYAALKAPLWPILFITVACGAISGFHSLVASGTTVKQIPRESDIRRIGYGAMVSESFFAILVLVAVGSMLTQTEYMSVVYPPGVATNPVLGFALGAGRLIHTALPFIPVAIAVVFGILMLEGFVVTTLDSSVRLCRYLLQEAWVVVFGPEGPAWTRNALINSGLSVGLMFLFAISGTVRQMWPVFGAGNQLIGALALTTVSVWLAQRARQTTFAVVPAVFMVITTCAALYILARNNLSGGNVWLGAAATGLLFLAVGAVVIGVSRFTQAVTDDRIRAES